MGTASVATWTPRLPQVSAWFPAGTPQHHWKHLRERRTKNIDERKAKVSLVSRWSRGAPKSTFEDTSYLSMVIYSFSNIEVYLTATKAPAKPMLPWWPQTRRWTPTNTADAVEADRAPRRALGCSGLGDQRQPPKNDSVTLCRPSRACQTL